MKSCCRTEWLKVGLLLAVHVTVSLAWSVALPMWQGMDEAVHFGLVQYIAESGRLPGPETRYRSDEIVLAGELSDVSRLPFDATQRQVFADGVMGPREAEIAALDPELRTRFERKARSSGMTIPPLYHGLAALFYRLAYGQDIVARAFAVRLCSVAIGALCVFFAYLLARQTWPSSPAMWVTVPLLVGMQPQFTYLAGGGTTDAMLNLCCTVLLFLMIRIVRCGIRVWDALLMGLTLGCGLLVKPMMLFVGPSMVLLWLWMGWRKRASWARLALYAALVGVVATSVFGWWAVRSLRINNSLFYDNPWLSGTAPLPANLDPDYPAWQYARDHLVTLWEGMFTSYWANFGYLDTPVSPAIYTVLRVLCILSAIGLAIQAWRLLSRRRFDIEVITALILGAAAVVPVLAMGYFGYSQWRQLGIGWTAMGRYYFVGLTAQMALLVWGLVSLFPSGWRVHAHLPLRAAAMLLNVVCLFGYVLPRYYL